MSSRIDDRLRQLNLTLPAPPIPGANYISAKTLGHLVFLAGVISTGPDGVITGSFSNGRSEPIGQLALATFSNPGGLTDEGNQMYAPSANSGQAIIGAPQTGGRGGLIGGSLETSNVDLAGQLTNLIMAQESYQANTKVVSTTSQVLQSLVNMP